MLRLPVMVAAGGINSAGRTSHRHGFRRMVLGSLGAEEASGTRRALAAIMGTDDAQQQDMGTLVRELDPRYFDHRGMSWSRRLRTDDAVRADMPVTQVMNGLPEHLKPRSAPGKRTEVELPPDTEVLLPGTRSFEVGAAGQLPQGFDPAAQYPSRNHPRGLQMSIYAASDALADLGIDWQRVSSQVTPDAISVYVSSSMGQLDDAGTGGMMRGPSNGKRVTSKQCPLGFAEMPGDFINAYVLRALGNTGPSVGACATFLYNLQRGVADIRAGRARIAVVGAAEAPIVSEVMEGYAAMGALATNAGLRALDGLDAGGDPDWRRACRPFGENCGFTMAESAQVAVLMDDELAISLGAPLLAAVPDVFVHADGAKKSISGPGAGNFLTMARATATLNAILGEGRLANGGMVQAHGTGTPQNRVTESEILSRVAGVFGIESWPVVAVKSYIGHSLGAAAGDQISAALGIWETGLLPAINTIDAVAEDVFQENLQFRLQTDSHDVRDYAIINSKGFGGNNASAALLSPGATLEILSAHHGERALLDWQRQNETVSAQREATESARLQGNWSPDYFFNDGVIDSDEIELSTESIRLGEQVVPLGVTLPQGWTLN